MALNSMMSVLRAPSQGGAKPFSSGLSGPFVPKAIQSERLSISFISSSLRFSAFAQSLP